MLLLAQTIFNVFLFVWWPSFDRKTSKNTHTHNVHIWHVFSTIDFMVDNNGKITFSFLATSYNNVWFCLVSLFLFLFPWCSVAVLCPPRFFCIRRISCLVKCNVTNAITSSLLSRIPSESNPRHNIHTLNFPLLSSNDRHSALKPRCYWIFARRCNSSEFYFTSFFFVLFCVWHLCATNDSNRLDNQ